MDERLLHLYWCPTQLQQDRDRLRKLHPKIIENHQNNKGLKSTRLETELNSTTDHLERTQTQLFSVLSASNVDQTALYEITKKIEVQLRVSHFYLITPSSAAPPSLFILRITTVNLLLPSHPKHLSSPPTNPKLKLSFIWRERLTRVTTLLKTWSLKKQRFLRWVMNFNKFDWQCYL